MTGNDNNPRDPLRLALAAVRAMPDGATRSYTADSLAALETSHNQLRRALINTVVSLATATQHRERTPREVRIIRNAYRAIAKAEGNQP
jgi:hypothetical protein